MKKIILSVVCSVFSISFAWADVSTNTVTADVAASASPTTTTEPAISDTDTAETPIQLSKTMQIVSKVEKFADPKLSYTVKLKYPLIQGSQLSVGAKAFNVAMAKAIKDQMLQFKTTAVLDQVNMKNLPEELRKDSFSLDYDVDIVKPKGSTLISVRFSIEGMQAGRAHPFHAKRVMNFDLATGREISLAQLFKPHSRYLQAIAAYSTKSLDDKLKKDAWMVASGTKPDPKNFKNWNLQEDSILITFDEYQVAPYVYGPQEVEIPYSALKKILSAKAPIADCVKDAKGCEVG